MGIVQEIRGREKYIASYVDYSALRSYILSATEEEGFVPASCRESFSRLMSLLQVPWQGIQTVLQLEAEGENFTAPYDPNRDYFIIPAAWEGGTGGYDPPWNEPDLETVAVSYGPAIATPPNFARDLETALALFREIRTGACSSGAGKLVIGFGVLSLASLGWLLWSKWRR